MITRMINRAAYQQAAQRRGAEIRGIAAALKVHPGRARDIWIRSKARPVMLKMKARLNAKIRKNREGL